MMYSHTPSFYPYPYSYPYYPYPRSSGCHDILNGGDYSSGQTSVYCDQMDWVGRNKIITNMTWHYIVFLQNDIIEWCRDHRTHHKFSETDADPHNAKRGFFFSHMGWLLVKKHPDGKAKGNTLDYSDLENDPVLRFQRKYVSTVLILWELIQSLPMVLFIIFNETRGKYVHVMLTVKFE